MKPISSELRDFANRDRPLERDLLSRDGFFDEAWYRRQPGVDADDDLVGHYLTSGWRTRLEPNASFAGTFFLPYFAAAGFHEPPAITWLMLRSAGWPTYGTQGEVEKIAAAIRATDLFDEVSYAARAKLTATGLDPATHYALLGERLGIAPSGAFDPAYYAERYPDLGACNLLLHYVNYGRAEGRHARPVVATARGLCRMDPMKENVLLVIHEASRTGAPILGWNIGTRLAKEYNLFTILIGDGELVGDFADLSVEMLGPFGAADRNPFEVDLSLRDLLGRRRFRYALINSLECRMVIPPCIRNFIPTLLLVHEFAAYYPEGLLYEALECSTEIIFPAPIVSRNAEEHYANLATRTVRILSQGVSQLPRARWSLPHHQTEPIRILRDRREGDGAFVVLGIGAVHLRKGVELFLSVAAAVQRAESGRPVHFVWIGGGFRPKEDVHYSAYLQEQISRSELSAHVTFLDPVTNLEPVYQLTDAFLLSSRLDPLPNVAIDAAVRGIPIVCFENASGMADLLLHDPETARGVVGHLDTEAAARVIMELASDEASRVKVSRATRKFAQATFDMEAYVASLDALGSAAAGRVAQQEIDAATLLSDDSFDQEVFLGPSEVVESRQQSIARYLAVAGARGAAGELMEDPNLIRRRPAPGFNPKIYRAANTATLLEGVDAFADFVRSGKPKGPWQLPVLLPDDPDLPAVKPIPKLRVAIQAHFFYPELAADFLARLRENITRCDLLISTSDSAKARRLARTMSAYSGGEVKIRVSPNRGRNLLPLLTAFADDLLEYDLIGHVHGKRSSWIGYGVGEIWREFLWQNLIGGLFPMMDRIVRQFERESELGLVFPSDPHVVGWSENRVLAASLAERMGLDSALTDAFDFPVGTMFWIRLQALRPLLALGLDWHDYPPEPLPEDGTMLHALERLLPFATKSAGFGYSVTHVPGVTR